jgi:hypothetical protein
MATKNMRNIVLVICAVGIAMFLTGSPAIFSGNQVHCADLPEPMHPGDRCGYFDAPHKDMKSYDEMAQEQGRNRTIGYAGVAVFAVGVIGLVVIVIDKRRR